MTPLHHRGSRDPTSSPSSLASQDLPGHFSYYDPEPSPSSPVSSVDNTKPVPRSSLSTQFLASYRSPFPTYPIPPPSLSPSQAPSLSPTRPSGRDSGRDSTSPVAGSPFITTVLPVSAAMPRSVSVDALSPAVASAEVMVHRLAQQNSRMRDAWEMERNHLEQSRKRAEELYREERAIMDDVRKGWEADRVDMADEIRILTGRLRAVEAENERLRTILTATTNETADETADEKYDAATPFSAGLDGTTTPGPARQQQYLSPLAGQQQAATPIIPGNQNTYRDDTEPPPLVEVVDVQAIHPELDGIPIKANAVQKTTFSHVDQSSSSSLPPSSAVTSPRPDDKSKPRHMAAPAMPMPRRTSSNEQTMLALAADEGRRLTMHAGHTPSHSLSLLPTVAATMTNQSRGSTPTQPDRATFSSSLRDEFGSDSDDKHKHYNTRNPDVPLSEPGLDSHGVAVEDAILTTPANDPVLRGPLMVRNIPAKDEIFFRLVNEKLEDISRDRNVVPAVMEGRSRLPGHSALSLSAQPGPSAHAVPRQERESTEEDDLHSNEEFEEQFAKVEYRAAKKNRKAQEAGGEDGNSNNQVGAKPGAGEHEGDDNHADDDDDDDDDDDKEDIPIRLKNTNNFGAPFGSL